MQKLYQSYVLTDDKEPFKFELKEIPIKSISLNGTIETKYPCFYGVMICTNYINGSGKIKTETEYSAGNSFVYYSMSYKNCMDYLAKKREELFQKYQKMLCELNRFYDKFLASEIKDFVDRKEIGMYPLWIEGYEVTGNSATASYLGVFEGKTFNEACDNWEKTIEQPEYYKSGNERQKPNYWACKIFENELEARKSFG